MIKLLRFLLTGDSHSHKWKIIGERRVIGDDSSDIPIGKKYVCQCEQCGTIKVFKTYD
jgi:hypothetical protein